MDSEKIWSNCSYQYQEQQQWLTIIESKNLFLTSIRNRKSEFNKQLTEIETNIAIVGCQFAQVLENTCDSTSTVKLTPNLESLAFFIHCEQVKRKIISNEMEILNSQEATVSNEIEAIKENMGCMSQLDALIST